MEKDGRRWKIFQRENLTKWKIIIIIIYSINVDVRVTILINNLGKCGGGVKKYKCVYKT